MASRVKSRSGSRSKGGLGEREVAALLNPVVHKVKRKYNIPEETIFDKHLQVQRNPQQSANGGADLVNTYMFAIEVKRSESLNINKWWDQTCKSAHELNLIPALIYRQNNRAWQVVLELSYTNHQLTLPLFRSTISIDSFLAIFERSVDSCIYNEMQKDNNNSKK